MEQLIIEKKYDRFEDFYDNEKQKIYEKIVEVYEKNTQNDTNENSLNVVAYVDGVEFTAEFYIDKNNTAILTETINPYFEENEDYELCDKIYKILRSIG